MQPSDYIAALLWFTVWSGIAWSVCVLIISAKRELEWQVRKWRVQREVTKMSVCPSGSRKQRQRAF